LFEMRCNHLMSTNKRYLGLPKQVRLQDKHGAVFQLLDSYLKGTSLSCLCS
jgi:hypothetical protein